MLMLYNVVFSFRYSNVVSKDYEFWGIFVSLVLFVELEFEIYLVGYCIVIVY